MPVSYEIYRMNVGHYKNNTNKQFINQRMQQQLLNKLAKSAGDPVKKARAELIVQSLLFITNINIAYSLSQAKTEIGSGRGGRQPARRHTSGPMLPLALAGPVKTTVMATTNNLFPAGTRLRPVEPTASTGTRHSVTPLPASDRRNTAWPAKPPVSPGEQKRAESGETTPAPLSRPRVKRNDEGPETPLLDEQTALLGRFLVKQDLLASGASHDRQALINSTIDLIVNERLGLSKIARHLIKPSGEYGSYINETLSIELQFNTVKRWLGGVFFDSSLGEFIGRAIRQAVLDNNCHAGQPLQLPFDVLDNQIKERLGGENITRPAYPGDASPLSGDAREYIMNEVVLADWPASGLPHPATAGHPVYVGTLDGGLLHVGLLMARQAEADVNALSIGELIQLGSSLQDMLHEGAVDPQWIALFELPAKLFAVLSNTERGSGLGITEIFHSEEGTAQALEAFFTAIDGRKSKGNPFYRLGTALQHYRTRTQLAANFSMPAVTAASDNAGDEPPPQSALCLRAGQRSIPAAADANQLFNEQNADIADKYAVVDSLLLALSFEQYDADEVVFLRAASVSTVSAEFSAFSSLRGQPAARTIPRRAYTVSLEPDVELFAAVQGGDKRIYALRLTAGRYVLSRIDYQVPLYYALTADGGRVAQNKDYKLKIYDTSYDALLLKSAGESLQQLADRLSQQHRSVVLTQLHEQGYEETSAEKVIRILLSLIPLHDCITDIVEQKKTVVISCSTDMFTLLPLAGKGLGMGIRFAQQGTRGSLLAYRATLKSLAVRGTLRNALQQGGKVLIDEAILPAAKELNRKALIELGLSAIRSIDPGLELLGRIGSGTIRQLVTAARLVEEIVPVWKKLIPGLESGLAWQTPPVLPGFGQTGRLPGLDKALPVVKLSGDMFENRAIYVQIDPQSGAVFGKKYTLSPEGVLHAVPKPIAKRLKNILDNGLSGRGAAQFGRRLATPRARSASPTVVPVNVDMLLYWIAHGKIDKSLSRQMLIRQFGVTENAWSRYVTPAGDLTAQAHELLAQAGMDRWNVLFNLPPELQQNIIRYIDVHNIENFRRAFPVYGTDVQGLLNLNALVNERLATLKKAYHDAYLEWRSAAIPGEKRWLAVIKLNEYHQDKDHLYNFLHRGNRQLALVGLQLRTLPALLPASLLKLDISANNLETLLPPLPPGLVELRVQVNRLTALPDSLPEGLTRLDAQYNRLVQLPSALPIKLARLDVSNNYLIALPGLPDALTHLDIGGNRLSQLPEYLPAALTHFKASGNQLTALPAQLPNGLKWLEARGNLISQLPDTLPPTIEFMDVSANQLTRLPPILPRKLKILDVGDNQLTELPMVLSPALVTLFVNNNQLSQLPIILPPQMLRLQVSQNALTSLPDTLPLGLKELNINGNRLPGLPGVLPPGLTVLQANANVLRSLPENLPDSLERLHIRNNPLTQLPARLPAALKEIDARRTGILTRPDNLPEPVRFIHNA